MVSLKYEYDKHVHIWNVAATGNTANITKALHYLLMASLSGYCDEKRLKTSRKNVTNLNASSLTTS